jgi:hypothetical protein
MPPSARSEFAHQLIQEAKEAAGKCLQRQLILEGKRPPFTLNDHYFSDSKAKFLDAMKAKLRPTLTYVSA